MTTNLYISSAACSVFIGPLSIGFRQLQGAVGKDKSSGLIVVPAGPKHIAETCTILLEVRRCSFTGCAPDVTVVLRQRRSRRGLCLSLPVNGVLYLR